MNIARTRALNNRDILVVILTYCLENEGEDRDLFDYGNESDSDSDSRSSDTGSDATSRTPYTYKRTVARCARVSKFWSSIALDLIWADLPDIVHLLSVLGEHQWMSVAPQYRAHFVRSTFGYLASCLLVVSISTK